MDVCFSNFFLCSKTTKGHFNLLCNVSTERFILAGDEMKGLPFTFFLEGAGKSLRRLFKGKGKNAGREKGRVELCK